MSESGVHRHDQHLVEVLRDLLQNGRASRRVNDDANPFSQGFDLCTVSDRSLLPSQ